MATINETAQFILTKLRHPDRFTAKRMFGEFGLYADGKMVALICDDRLYVKIAPPSAALEPQCEKGEPYPRSKLHYLIDEGQLSTIPTLPSILLALAEAMPEKKTKARTTETNRN
ncbi:MAG TPA: TfoX/Sxy family protein [Verrucomicrobiae bacterium]